ncbi:DUF1302 domain-containing protein [Pseudomonas aeruginosa]|uniref:DUF1302 domain-containing protein n=1 Tax=Pseudomonas aeruginosa group TaxID=136841 RepID=UPI000D1B4691|nr:MULTISPECIES: DUF1302 domain-containing protein [Pseudomonas aeruginosa group]EKJ9725351.1 DUF1302 domain-containing protein [Pseudomonas aeruginosa]EKW8363620.1 DUF1302 domain-containing protein [Pseudomonas aeruginosa]MBM2727706.1 DUF1302 domain-containing protein [Pseudomonas aeruginosa]MCR3762499.1 DUF1302 domain-containing protein [Pseudomonas aeruginosa]PTC33747.1 hypothetical protein CLJ1_5857 [Pseudomonas aeruginosa]
MPTHLIPAQLSKLSSAIAVSSLLITPAYAVDFSLGEIDGQFDSSLSVGASWSTASPNKDLIGKNNGGRGMSQTSDDSRMNFKRGETFSKIFKGIHDLDLRYKDTGVFVRGKYWYDFELKDESRLFKDISDSNRKEGAKSSGAELLDAFVYYNYLLVDQPGSVRLGRQVVSWGESTFLQSGINAINPIDVAAFRRPGAELKEGLTPVNMFYLSQSVTEDLSSEFFYQLEWEQSTLDNCGTFFAQTDIVPDGCENNLAALNPSLGQFASLAGPLAYQTSSEGVLIPRGGDRDPRDGGQWGLALRYLFEPLDTEFGAYFMNYHSRLPIFSGTAPGQSVYNAIPGYVGNVCGLIGAACTPSLQSGLASALVAGNARYFIEYPEDIKLYGLSFSTTLPTGTAWAGEISYRPNAPVQINSTDVLYSALTPLDPTVSILSVVPGQDTHGYRRKEITQLQTTFTHFFDQVMGASRLTLVGEVGWTHVGGLDSNSDVRYGRDPVFGPGELPNGRCQSLNAGTLGTPNGKNGRRFCGDDGFTTQNSWGYRVRAIWDYPDVFAGVNLKPNVAWSHDVDGYSPGPGGNFEEGRKAVSLGIDAEYMNKYSSSLSYTNFFDGKYSTTEDRDFVALSFGVNF